MPSKMTIKPSVRKGEQREGERLFFVRVFATRLVYADLEIRARDKEHAKEITLETARDTPYNVDWTDGAGGVDAEKAEVGDVELAEEDWKYDAVDNEEEEA